MTARASACGMIALGLVAASAGCGGGGGLPTGDPVAGERIVETEAQPNCGRCHTLEAAEFEGTTAPNLDELRPGYQRVLDAIRDGPGFMPSYSDQLDERELHDVAAYISEAAGR